MLYNALLSLKKGLDFPSEPLNIRRRHRTNRKKYLYIWRIYTSAIKVKVSVNTCRKKSMNDKTTLNLHTRKPKNVQFLPTTDTWCLEISSQNVMNHMGYYIWQTSGLWHSNCLSYNWSNLTFPLHRPSSIQLMYLKRNRH